MKYLKKWSFFIILAGVGIVCFLASDTLSVRTFFPFSERGDGLGARNPDAGPSQEPGGARESGGDSATGEGDSGEDASGGTGAGPGQEGGSGQEAGLGQDGDLGQGAGLGQEDGSGQGAGLGSSAQGDGLGQGAGLGQETALGGNAQGNGREPGGEKGQPSGQAGEPDTGSDPSAQGRETNQEIVFGTVEDDYFSDALFLGDSRTVGLYKYGELQDVAAFYASTGMTIYKLFDAQIVEEAGESEPITVEEALTRHSFRKIYMMMGINEMGRGTVEEFASVYAQAVEHIEELQPDAIIYIQAILKVSSERSQKGDYITNQGIEERNAALAALADGRRVFFLDPNAAVCGEDGGMNPEYTGDGVHLKAKYISLWKDFLKQNAVLLDGEASGE